MKTFLPMRHDHPVPVLPVLAIVAAAVVAVVMAATTPKITFYLDRLETTGLLYALAPLIVAGLVVQLRHPRLSLYVMVFLIPFHTIGGAWGELPAATLGKIAINLSLVAGLFSTVLALPADRAWITRSRLGHALLVWLLFIAVGFAVGFFSTPNRDDWVREFSWMVLYAAALPVGTLLRDRRDIDRLILAGGIGVGIMQVYAFWTLATGRRFNRRDVEGGEAFFRAPFSAFSVFYLLLLQAMFFFGSAAKGRLTRRQLLAAYVGMALLSAGLLATMGRSLWISAAVGTMVVLFLSPWKASTVRAVSLAAAGLVAAVGMVVLIDGLSPQSRGNWTRLAVNFFFALGERGSVTTLSREFEWIHAIEVWKLSPVVGYGFGYPFPDNPYSVQDVDRFYMHNSYLNVLAKCGALGMLAMLWMVAITFQRLARNYFDVGADLHDRILASALLAGVAQMVVLSLFSPSITTTDSVLGMAVLIGLAAAQHRVIRLRGTA